MVYGDFHCKSIPFHWRFEVPSKFLGCVGVVQMSLVYIGLMTYGVVWMVTRIGCAFGISTAIMVRNNRANQMASMVTAIPSQGLTVVAAGTSVPDCIGSVIVARKGQG